VCKQIQVNECKRAWVQVSMESQDQLIDALQIKLREKHNQIDDMINATFATNQKVDASCDTKDLIENIDATCDTEVLVQKVDTWWGRLVPFTS